jgi:hypothetical protein
VFLHVPKAGGTALGGALGNRFAADACLDTYHGRKPSDEELNAARYLTGHISMSILDRFEQSPFSITVLRDPIERALSTYSFFRELDQPPTGLERHDAAARLAKQHSLEEFIEAAPDIAEHYLGNWQARMLGGKRLDRTDERLEDALAGLRRCDFVGLAERQDESIAWLTRRLGWAELTPLPLAMVTRTRLRSDQISPAAMERLLRLTSVDRDLYADALRLYASRLEEWEAGEQVTDGSAEIEDALLVSDLGFGKPIRGAGWLGRERVGDEPHICWIGHTATAWVELADDPAARWIAIEIRHVIDPAMLGTLRITVDGEVVPHRLAESGEAVVASGPLERRVRRNTALRVELTVDHASRPCDIDPTSGDNRELAIAVRRIALSRRG